MAFEIVWQFLVKPTKLITNKRDELLKHLFQTWQKEAADIHLQQEIKEFKESIFTILARVTIPVKYDPEGWFFRKKIKNDFRERGSFN